MITAYDFSFARIFDHASIDIILVGDSASNVAAGPRNHPAHHPDQMIYHAQSVVRGIDRCLVVVDMPLAITSRTRMWPFASAIKIMKGNRWSLGETRRRRGSPRFGKKIVKRGYPRHGSPGTHPQSIYKFGTYNVRAKEEEEAAKLKRDALLLQEVRALCPSYWKDTGNPGQ